MHIATAPELWFEKPGNSPPAAPPAEKCGPAGAPDREPVLTCNDAPRRGQDASRSISSKEQ
jgi:hypothetical protein